MGRFYAFDPFDGCHKTFSTAEAAEAEAHACIEYGRDRDRWPEETDQIEWGMLVQLGRAQQVNRVEAADDDTGRCAREDLAYLCDYGLTVEPNPLDAAERERDDARAEVETLRAEAALLREIIEGRTTPPIPHVAAPTCPGLWWRQSGTQEPVLCNVTGNATEMVVERVDGVEVSYPARPIAGVRWRRVEVTP